MVAHCNRALAIGPVTVQSIPPDLDALEDLLGDAGWIEWLRDLC